MTKQKLLKEEKTNIYKESDKGLLLLGLKNLTTSLNSYEESNLKTKSQNSLTQYKEDAFTSLT